MAEHEGCAGEESHLFGFDASTSGDNHLIEHAGDMSCNDEPIPQTSSPAPHEAHTLSHQSSAHEKPVTASSYLSIKEGPTLESKLNRVLQALRRWHTTMHQRQTAFCRTSR